MIALLEIVLGIGGAGYFLWLGLQAEASDGVDRSPLDHAFPFVLAAGFLLLVVVGARRRRKTAGRSTVISTPTATAGRFVPAVAISEAGALRVAGIVAELHDAGVLAPRAPDPRHLFEAVADAGEPVTVETALAALHEVSYYHPDVQFDGIMGNLVFHASHTEQFDDVLRDQIGDLVRLAAGALDVTVIDIEQQFATDADTRNRTRIRLSVNGEEQALDYPGLPKYLSTVVHVALAAAMRATGAPRRLAWLWDDQGVWITTLPAGALDRLNAALGLDEASLSRWEPVDEQEPIAAGG